MGSMQFLLPRREGLAELAVACAYLIGHDGAPWESQVEFSQGRLVVRRDSRESGRLVAPWPIAGADPVALSTATLIPRETPYHLALELCRGTLARILGQFPASILEQPTIQQAVREAEYHFIEASLRQRDIELSAVAAETALAICLQTIPICLAAQRSPPNQSAYCSRLTGFQVVRPQQLERLNRVAKLPGNATFYNNCWREVEANPGEYDWQCWDRDLKRIRRARRRVVAGPLFRLTRQELPDWLYLWDDDFDALQSYLIAYVHAATQRLHADVNLWYVTAGTNIETELHLGEEQRLRLTLAALETLRSVDTQTPAIVGIRQPWGEYLGHTALDLSPWQFADIIVRAGIGVSGFALEMNLGCETGYTMPRDLLELNRLVDQWSALGLPLVVILSAPVPVISAKSAATQVSSVREFIELLQHKPAIQGIIWSQVDDAKERPAGVLTAEAKPKPILAELTRLWSPPTTPRR